MAAHSRRHLLYVVVSVPVFLIAVCFDLVRVSGISMEDALHEGDTLLTARVPPFLRSRWAMRRVLSRGRIVLLRRPDDPGMLAVKRIVGLDGDGVSIDNGVLVLNGVRQVEPYAKNRLPQNWPTPTQSLGPRRVIVPAGHLFLLSDNRTGTYDSRTWGAVPEEAIVGLIVAVVAHERPFS